MKIHSLPNLNKIRFLRNATDTTSIRRLHGFCDASTKEHGAYIYLRYVTKKEKKNNKHKLLLLTTFISFISRNFFPPIFSASSNAAFFVKG